MNATKENKDYFTQELMHWHCRHNTRTLPWKEESDPYKIWLSEIILQQTRVDQGLPYYLKFAAAYPSVQDLAAAPDDEAFKLWEGLGYYARCRNMLATARQVAGEHGGIFPDTYEGLLALKGIGPYTAAAIASFAYSLPHAVVDGNVYRVLARYFGIDILTEGVAGKRLFQSLADSLLDHSDPGGFNQAVMDLGALVCTPALPKCAQCPLAEGCIARAEGLIDQLPVPRKKPQLRARYFHYLLIHHENSLWIRIRNGKDIWKGLYEPLLIEEGQALEAKAIAATPAFPDLQSPDQLIYEGSLSQRLSHQQIESRFFALHTAEKPALPGDGVWVPLQKLSEYPFPRTLIIFFEKKGYF